MTSEPTGQGKTVLVDEKPAIIFHLNSAFSPVACFNICFFLNFFHFQGNQHFKCFLRQTAACVYLYWGFTANIYISWHLPVHVFNIYKTIWTHLSYRCMHVTKINFRSSIRSKFSKFLFKSLFRTHINKFKLFIEFEFIS